MTDWIISDLHLGHENIIKYCDRPFKDVEEMNRIIITRWNNLVANDDVVYFLGDMSYGRGSGKPGDWIRLLNGELVYFKGSHDIYF